MHRYAYALCVMVAAACHAKTGAAAADKVAHTDSPAGPSAEPTADLPPVPADNSHGSQLVVDTPNQFAVVVVDGVARGTTPRTEDNPIFVAPGAHTVELRFLPSGPNKTFRIQSNQGETYKMLSSGSKTPRFAPVMNLSEVSSLSSRARGT